MRERVFRPIPATTAAYIGAAVIFMGFGIWIALTPITQGDPQPDLLPVSCSVGLPIGLIFLVTAIGGARMKLVLADDHAYVRNVFHRRRIARADVTGFGWGKTIYLRDFPAIEWLKDGKPKKTVVAFLSGANLNAPFEIGQTTVSDMTDDLAAWCAASPRAIALAPPPLRMPTHPRRSRKKPTR
jgi:hypothetical protein